MGRRKAKAAGGQSGLYRPGLQRGLEGRGRVLKARQGLGRTALGFRSGLGSWQAWIQILFTHPSTQYIVIVYHPQVGLYFKFCRHGVNKGDMLLPG